MASSDMTHRPWFNRSRIGLVSGTALLLSAVASPTNVPAATAYPTAVLGWSPDAAEEVPLSAPITVYFNRPMDHASVQHGWSLSPATPGAIHWSGNAVQFVPSHEYRPSTAYRLSISAAAHGMDGVPLNATWHVSFVTGAGLRVLNVSPAAGTRQVTPAGQIRVTFSQPMVPLQSTDMERANPMGWTVSISPHTPGYGSWLGTSTWVYHPFTQLHPASRYVISLAPAVRDSWGEPLGRTVRWSFTTQTPEILSRSPHNGSRFVNPYTAISVTFDQQMDPASTAASFHVSRQGVKVPGRVTWTGTTFIFHPASPLAGSYRASVGSGARSLNREATVRPASWSFRASPLPRLLDSDPRSGGTAYASGPFQSHFGWLCCYAYGVTFDFNALMDKRSLDRHLVITPSVSRTQTWFNGPDQNDIFQYNIAGDFSPSTRYTIKLVNGVRDVFGRSLNSTRTLRFTTSTLYPFLSLYGNPGSSGEGIAFSSGQSMHAPLQDVNVQNVHYTLIRTNLYGLNSNRCQGCLPAGTLIRKWNDKPDVTTNKVTNAGVLLTQPNGGPLEPGLYWLDALGPDRGIGWPSIPNGPPDSSETVLVTNVSVTMKSESEKTLIWVTDARTGKPVANAPVRLTDYLGRTLAGGTTDARGIRVFQGMGRGRPHAAVVFDGSHFGMSESFWSPNVDSPTFLPSLLWPGGGYTPGGTYLYTDRPVYRPGQQVHFRGILWRDRDGVYSLLGRTRVTVRANDSQGHPLYQRALLLDRFGAVHGSFSLPRSAATGDTFVQAWVNGSTSVSTMFTIAEYRKPEFLASLHTSAQAYVRGDVVHASAVVRYVFGEPAARTHVNWSAYQQPQYPQPPGWDTYQFYNWEDLWQQNVQLPQPQAYQASQFGVEVASGSGSTDAQGRLNITMPVRFDKESLDRTVTLEVTSTDINAQSVSSRITIPEYRSALAIGLAVPRQTLPVGQPQRVDVVAVRHDGTPISGQRLSVGVFKRTYTSKLVDSGQGQSAWQAVPHDQRVGTYPATSDPHGKASITFTPHAGGEYRVVVSGRDPKGNRAEDSISVDASTAGFADWGSSSGTGITLKPDRGTYRVGDTAHILVPLPFSDATALVTTERGSIRSSRVVHLAGNSSSIDLPIRLGDLPNVFVTVTAYRGWRNNSPPEWRYGTAELHVRVDPKRVIVRLAQNGYRHHPGDDVTYSLSTTDSEGHPVSAQLSLALVDTAVLALHDENNPDILQALYAERQLTVSTASDAVLSIDHLQLQPSFEVSGGQPGGKGAGYNGAVPAQRAATGGGGGGPPTNVTVRTNFLDTAFWRGDMVTDARGRGVLHVKLPDNATTWRLDARAVSAGQAVGQDAIHTLATQDLVVRPVLPRFFVQGDRLRIGAVLNNLRGVPVRARMTLNPGGLRGAGSLSVEMSVTAHGERMVLWPVAVPVVQRAQVTVVAQSLSPGVRGDAVQTDVPVRAPVTDETVATAGQVYGSMKQDVVVPRGAVAVPGALTVRISASLIAGLGAAYAQLHAVPDESNDSIASRILAAASLRSVPRSITGLSAQGYAQLSAALQKGVGVLLRRQYGDGSWPWYTSPYYYEGDPFTTTDILQALIATHVRSPDVVATIQRAARYLTQAAPQLDASERAGILGVLSSVDGRGRSQAEYLYNDSIRRLHLDSGPLAQLALSLSRSGDGGKAKTLAGDLDEQVKVSATGAHWESSSSDYWSGPAISSTTEVLGTLLRLRPQDPLIPAAVRWLMLSREGDRWDSSRDTSQAIAVLTGYARAAREGTAEYSYRVVLNGRQQASGRYTAANQRATWSGNTPIAHLHRTRGNTMTISRGLSDGSAGVGPLYYLARLHYYLPAQSIARKTEGLTISRSLVDLHGRVVHRVRVGSAIRVRLTLHTDQTLMYLNIQDPICAGCEPIDESLNTSRQGLFGSPAWQLPGTISDLSWFLTHSDLHDNRVSLYALMVPPGTYRYTYLIQATIPGQFAVPPTHASETFFPEVFGRSSGQSLQVT